MTKITEHLFRTPLAFHSFNIHELQIRKVNSGMVQLAQGEKAYTILIFHSASVIRCADVTYTSSAPIVVIYEPNTPQDYGHPDAIWEYSRLLCDGILIRKLLSTADLPCNKKIVCTDPATLDAILTMLSDDLSRSGGVHPLLIEQLLTKLLHTIAASYQMQQAVTGVPQAFVEAKQYLELNYATPIQLPDLAKQANYSVVHFSREFRKYFHTPPIDYLIKIRLQHAAELLGNPNMTIETVAGAVGYDSAKYFAKLFRQHYGIPPSEWRTTKKDTYRQEVTKEDFDAQHIERWLQEDWKEVLSYDCTRHDTIDPRFTVYQYGEDEDDPFPKPERLQILDDHLSLSPLTEWTMLRWDGDLADDVKLDVVLLNNVRDGLNVSLAIGGDNRDGYRLRLEGYEHIVLETTCHGYWELLYDCRCSLNPHAVSYRVTFWRSGYVFYAEINGQRILTYSDPPAPRGTSRHRTFSISRLWSNGSCAIRELRVYTRQRPLFSDILELGRVMFWLGHTEDAYQWFMQLAEERNEPSIRQEAQYFAALALSAESPDKEAMLAAIASDADHLFCVRALRALAHWQVEHGEFDGAVQTVQRLFTFQDDYDTSQQVADKIMHAMREGSPLPSETLWALLAQLPLERLYLHHIELGDLTPLQGKPLRSINLTAVNFHSLEPLSGMPLVELTCSDCGIADLSPLRGMPLTELRCSKNQLHDLSPLCGLPLRKIDCACNAIKALTPLAGLPLVDLCCANNQISDLAPLENLPLHTFNCIANTISSLENLRKMPLLHLYCGQNPLDDLSPLQDLTLETFSCSATNITDLSPLKTHPLHQLDCGGTRVVDLSPLRGKSITDLAIPGIPLSLENLAILRTLPCRYLRLSLMDAPLPALLEACPRLVTINNYLTQHIAAIGVLVQRAVEAWRAGMPGLPYQTALQDHARRYGDTLYLALPIEMGRREAQALVHWLGGKFPCLATPVKSTDVYSYFAAITLNSYDIAFHFDSPQPPAAENMSTDGTTIKRRQIHQPIIAGDDDQVAAVIVMWEL